MRPCPMPPVIAICLLGAVPVLAIAGDARDWLARMERAVESLSYEGTFIHVLGEQIETLHVIHRAQDGQVSERLYSRDQPGREVLRHEDKVTCIFADQKTVLVERRQTRHATPLLGAVRQGAGHLDEWYAFELAGDERKLGRTARIIEIRPHDDYRYGHRLWLDHDTAIPLKIQLLEPGGRLVEQIQFVTMVVPAEISDARLQSEIPVDGFDRHEQPVPDWEFAAPVAAWRAADPPPGFVLNDARVRVMQGGDQPVEHLVYSDGLASVSIYVETAHDKDEALSGLSRMGAAHAFTWVVEGRQVTAVGEVPPKTVERLARSLHRSAGEPD